MDLTFDVTFLSRLRFVTRRRRRGGTWGERRSTRRGAGIEFADYRAYTPGDDPRRVDWNLYARLDRPYVRLYEEEEDLSVAVLLDGSASMGWGADPALAMETLSRWAVAQQLTIALGSVALLSGDVLTGALLHMGEVAMFWGPARGRVQIPRWQAWGGSTRAFGDTQIGRALQRFAARGGRPGLALLVTDGYDVLGLQEGIAALAARGYEIVLLHVLTPEELVPTLRGDLRLVDSERADKREVTLNRVTLEGYQQRLTAWQAELRALMAKHGGRYALLRADFSLRNLILGDLRRAGILR